MRHPSLAWALPLLDAALDDLVALERDPQADLNAARQAATASDLVFDNYTRGLYWLCRGLVAIALARGDETGAAAFSGLRDALLPAGMAPVNWSYIEEAAEADRVEGRLEAHHRQLLADTPVLGGSFAALVGEWQQSARVLGEADRTRTDIEADMVQNRAPALSRVRRRWMDTINAMRAAAALLPETERLSIFRKLDESEARADARVASRRAAGAATADVDESMPLDGADVRAPDEGDEPSAQAAPEPEAGAEPAAGGASDAPAGGAGSSSAGGSGSEGSSGPTIRPIRTPGSQPAGDAPPA